MNEPTHCQCAACKFGVIHASDCAVHNAPFEANGPCDCGAANAPTLRDYFAAKALQGLLANSWGIGVDTAKSAYTMADIMINERGQP